MVAEDEGRFDDADDTVDTEHHQWAPAEGNTTEEDAVH